MSDISNQGYAGLRDWTSATSQYNRMEFIFRALSLGMATSTIVRVQAVHPGSGLLPGTVDIQLLINQQDSQGNSTPHGIVCGVPYSRVAAGKSAIIVDPAVNDIGIAVFASRDISSVPANLASLQSGKITSVNPGSFRAFDYSDGMYLFSVESTIQPTDYIQILPTGGMNMIDRFGNSIVTANGGITINGILFPTGGNSFNIKTHTHDQGNDSHGDTEEPTEAPNNGS